MGQGASAPPTRSTRKDDRPGRGDQGAHRRLRRRRGHRGGRPPGGVPSRRSTPATSPARVVLVGVPDPDDDDRAAADRVLRPRRRAEVLLVRRLPAQPRLPDAHRPLPAGPASTSTASSPRRSASTTSRRRSTRCTAARCCARSWCSDDRADRPGRRQRRLQPRRAGLRRRQQRLARRRRRRGAGHRRRARRRPDRRGDRRPAGDRDRAHPRAQRPHHRRGRRCARPPARRSGSTRPTGCSGTSSTRRRPGPTSSPRARRFDVAGTTLVALHTPGHSPGSTCLYAADLGTVFTGDTLFYGGPGATGARTATTRRSSSRSARGC